VVGSEPSGTSTKAEITPVITRNANNQAAAAAYSRTRPRISSGYSRQAIAARRIYSSIPAHRAAGSR